MNFISYESRDEWANAIAAALEEDLRRALGIKSYANFAVAGGSTPALIFRALRKAHLEWARVTIMPSDERWVKPGHSRSNATMIRTELLQEHARAAHFEPLLCADFKHPEAALEEIAGRIEPYLPLDVALLGMGADRHIASLFPCREHMNVGLQENAPAVLAIRLDDVDEARVTLSLPIFQRARALHVALLGEDKRQALEMLPDLPLQRAPIKGILEQATLHWTQ